MNRALAAASSLSSSVALSSLDTTFQVDAPFRGEDLPNNDQTRIIRQQDSNQLRRIILHQTNGNKRKTDLLADIAAGVLDLSYLRQWKNHIRSFAEEMRDHMSDDALYTLFRQLQAPHDFHQHALSRLTTALHQCFDGCWLNPRGSIRSRTGLSFTADLDVDLVLPRSMCLSSPTEEDFSEYYKRAPDRFPQLVRFIAELLRCKQLPDLPISPNASFTRSISFRMDVDGIGVDVDLFPKLLDAEGNICGVSPRRVKDVGQGQQTIVQPRQWLITPARVTQRPAPEFTAEEQAAIIFLKVAKVQRHSSFSRGGVCGLKSFHINLAMECSRVPESTNMPGDAVAEEEQKTSAAGGSEQASKRRKIDGDGHVSLGPATDDISHFTRNGVFMCMFRALKFLNDACDLSNREDAKYCRNGVNMITQELEDDEVRSLVETVDSIRRDLVSLNSQNRVNRARHTGSHSHNRR